MGCHFLLQGIFPNQGSNLRLLPWQVDSLPLSHWEALRASRGLVNSRFWHSDRVSPAERVWGLQPDDGPCTSGTTERGSEKPSPDCVLRREVAKGKDSLGAHNLNEGTSRRCVSNTNGVFKTM